MRAWQLLVCTAIASIGCDSSNLPPGPGLGPELEPDSAVPQDQAQADPDAGCSRCTPPEHDAAVWPGLDRDAGGGREPDVDASEPEPGTSDSCEAYADGYYAIRTVLDVWWPGSKDQIDPGRGTVTVHALARYVAPERTGDAGRSLIKLCGVALPTFTSDATCRALQLELPDAAWASASWSAVASEGPIHEGDVLRWSEVVSRVETVAEVRADGAEYLVPFDSAPCSDGTPYRFARWPTTPGRGPSSSRAAASLELSLAARASGDALLANDCKCSVSELDDPLLELSVLSCASTLHVERSDDEQHAHADCSTAELAQLQETLPALHALGLGDTPGAIELPRGWDERDIDRRPSQGTRTHLVHLRDGAAEPSCAELHAVPFPRL